MPFDIGFGEVVLIGIIALIVVGPKDLPQLFRSVGRFMGRMRAMADEFRHTMENAADEAGVHDIKKDIKEISDNDLLDLKDTENALRDLNNTKLDHINKSASELESELTVSGKSGGKSSGKSGSGKSGTKSKAKSKTAALKAKTASIKADAKAKMLSEQAAAKKDAAKKKAALKKAEKQPAKETAKKTAAKKPAKKPASKSKSSA